MRRGLSLVLTSALLMCGATVAAHASPGHVHLCNRSAASVTPMWFLTNTDSTGASAPRLAQGGGKALAAGKCDDSTSVPASKADLYIVVTFKTASGRRTPAVSYPLANTDVNIQASCSTEMDDAAPVCIRSPK
jgi:hypothetical protein